MKIIGYIFLGLLSVLLILAGVAITTSLLMCDGRSDLKDGDRCGIFYVKIQSR